MTLVARLKVTLSGVEPQVLRRFDVQLKIKLNRLHDVIQAAMGWTDSHLYEFRAGGVGWGVPDPDGYYDGPLPANKSSLLDVLEDVGTKTIHYIYDFGDNWHHVIKVEKIPGGDDSRRFLPPDIDGESAAFMMMNRGKRGGEVRVPVEGIRMHPLLSGSRIRQKKNPIEAVFCGYERAGPRPYNILGQVKRLANL